jgi:hypothetical protein
MPDEMQELAGEILMDEEVFHAVISQAGRSGGTRRRGAAWVLVTMKSI